MNYLDDHSINLIYNCFVNKNPLQAITIKQLYNFYQYNTGQYTICFFGSFVELHNQGMIQIKEFDLIPLQKFLHEYKSKHPPREEYYDTRYNTLKALSEIEFNSDEDSSSLLNFLLTMSEVFEPNDLYNFILKSPTIIITIELNTLLFIEYLDRFKKDKLYPKENQTFEEKLPSFNAQIEILHKWFHELVMEKNLPANKLIFRESFAISKLIKLKELLIIEEQESNLQIIEFGDRYIINTKDTYQNRKQQFNKSKSINIKLDNEYLISDNRRIGFFKNSKKSRERFIVEQIIPLYNTNSDGITMDELHDLYLKFLSLNSILNRGSNKESIVYEIQKKFSTINKKLREANTKKNVVSSNLGIYIDRKTSKYNFRNENR